MKRVRVLIPFHLAATKTDHVAGDEIVVSDEQLARIRAINVNMVEVLGEVKKAPAESKPKAKAKK